MKPTFPSTMADAAKDASSTHHHHQTSSTSTSFSRPSPQQQATTAAPTPRISVEDASSSCSSSSHHLSPSSVDSSPRRRFKSYRLRAAYEKPWLRDPNLGSTRWNDLVVCVFVLLGLLGAGGIAFVTVWPYRSGDVSSYPSLPPPQGNPIIQVFFFSSFSYIFDMLT